LAGLSETGNNDHPKTSQVFTMTQTLRHVWIKTDETNPLETREPTLLAQYVKVANKPWLRLLGLMGKATLKHGEGLWLQPCNSVHSCFMRFDFDAIFLDKTGQVVALQESMRPWRLSRIYPKAQATLELPAGSIKQMGLQVGMRLAWQDKAIETN
jgi:uncharacterized protein